MPLFFSKQTSPKEKEEKEEKEKKRGSRTKPTPPLSTRASQIQEQPHPSKNNSDVTHVYIRAEIPFFLVNIVSFSEKTFGDEFLLKSSEHFFSEKYPEKWRKGGQREDLKLGQYFISDIMGEHVASDKKAVITTRKNHSAYLKEFCPQVIKNAQEKDKALNPEKVVKILLILASPEECSELRAGVYAQPLPHPPDFIQHMHPSENSNNPHYDIACLLPIITDKNTTGKIPEFPLLPPNCSAEEYSKYVATLSECYPFKETMCHSYGIKLLSTNSPIVDRETYSDILPFKTQLLAVVTAACNEVEKHLRPAQEDFISYFQEAPPELLAAINRRKEKKQQSESIQYQDLSNTPSQTRLRKY